MTIFETTPDDIEQLDDISLRTLIGYLAEQEVIVQGGSPAAVTYGGDQKAKDGGIDVRVDCSDGSLFGFVPRSQSGFQVKADDMAKGDILKEMRPKGVLRESIRKLGEAGGAYIIACSRGDLSDTSLTSRRNAMAEAIADTPTAAALKLDFYDRRRIATWVNRHPGLVSWVRERIGKPLQAWRPFADWSSSPGKLEEEYILDKGVRITGLRIKDSDGLDAVAGLNRVRQTLANPKGVVRLVGLSGVGKTRFVQAVFDKRVGEHALSPHLVVYADLADEPNPVPLELLDRLHKLKQRCVLVVDNCGVELHQKLAKRIRSSNGEISLITVEYDISDDEPEGTEILKLDSASIAVISEILKRKYPELSGPDLDRIASFSEGNSRVALALAETAQTGSSVANLRDSELFKRIFRQRNDDNYALLRAAKICALVYSFDGVTLDGDAAELPILANLAGQSVEEFYSHVAELQRRQLVQSRAQWRALLPHALAHRLAREALQDIPQSVINDTFKTCVIERLVKSFSRRLGYLHDSPAAQAIVQDWLDDPNFLANAESLNEFGLFVFDNIAPVNTEATLTAVERASEKILSSEKIPYSSQKFVQILRQLAYEPSMFDRAISLIGRYAYPAEDSNNMSDAINVFRSLFTITLSGTHAPASKRADYLRRLSASSQESDRKLVLAGMEEMLKCRHFSSSYGFDFGARKRDYGFHPRSPKEASDWFSTAIQLIADLEKVAEFRASIRILFATEFAALYRCTGMIDQMVELGKHLAADCGWPEGWVGVRGAIREARSIGRKEDVDKLKAFAQSLKPDTLGARIITHVLPEEWSRLDVAEFDLDDPKKYLKARTAAELHCKQIGEELSTDETILIEHLPWLLASRSGRVFLVGRGLGGATKNPKATWDKVLPIVSPDLPGTGNFLAGFLGGVCEVDPDMVEDFLDEIVGLPDFHKLLVYFQVRVGMSQRGFARMMDAVKLDSVPGWSLENLGHGRACDGLSGAEFRDLVSAISARDDGIGPAVDVMRMRVFSLRSDKKQLGEDDRAAGRELLSKLAFERRKNIEGHSLADIAAQCLVAPTDKPVADILCTRLLEAVSQYRVSAWDYSKLVSVLAAKFPISVLDILVERKGSQYHGRRAMFSDFRLHKKCPLDDVDPDILIGWANENPAERCIQLAKAIRVFQAKDGTHDEDQPGELSWSPTALRLIATALDPIAVLETFKDRFHPSGWSGSLASVLASRMPLLEEIKDHSNETIANWAKANIDPYAQMVEQARASEERENRQRDERFEW